MVIQLRNSVSNQFGYFSQSFFYDNSTIPSLQKALMNKTYMDKEERVKASYERTQRLAESYIAQAKVDFPVSKNDPALLKADQIVMLTGATGTLGALILVNLLKAKNVKKIYCLMRGEESELKDRLVNAFQNQHLDTLILETDRIELLSVHLADPHLGLPKKRYDQLKEQVTIVQHCAWLMDFNQNIDYYEKEYISPFYNLVKFAYREVNPMHLHFVSSVSASLAMGSDVLETPLPLDSRVSSAMGYAQSKFVCEALLNYLVKEKNMACYIERIGQIAGNTESGVWKTNEMYPLLFTCGILLGKMPNLPTQVDWIPSDYAAATITEIMLSTSQLEASVESSVYNVVNPQTQSWSSFLETIQLCGVKFETVEVSEWIKALSKDSSNPSYRLMPFYQDHLEKDQSVHTWQTTRTCRLYPTLLQAPQIGPELFQKYLDYWKSVGFC